MLLEDDPFARRAEGGTSQTVLILTETSFFNSVLLVSANVRNVFPVLVMTKITDQTGSHLAEYAVGMPITIFTDYGVI